ncbi:MULTISPECIES: putative lipid II flippase FtsW [unclassified Acinetobacter]|uniref:putative lipid II flippase FtsW n=1 Tax=unclassified Acinetobacter TaxID=196816 RepID=UPI0035BADF9C
MKTLSNEQKSNRVNRFFNVIENAMNKVFAAMPKEINHLSLLLFCVTALLLVGSVMVASASMPYAATSTPNGNELYFFTRHLAYLFVASIFAAIAYFIPTRYWFDKLHVMMFIASFTLLFAVLFVGKEVNGSSRWIEIAGVTFQPSELAKFAMIAIAADFVVTNADAIRVSVTNLLRLCVSVGIIVGLIGTQDLGAAIVVFISVAVIIFLAGIPFLASASILGLALSVVVIGVLLTPWRLERVLSFLDPWSDRHGTGYQLTQSLMAFGRGEWTGVGLGQSVQKLAYLPEAHTDFMLAISAEELGFFGVFSIFALSFLLVACCMRIGMVALRNNHLRAGYLCYGIASIFLFQTCVNAGMNMGLLPVKGLTLPFISYGGSSLVVCAVMIAVVVRIAKTTSTPNINDSKT